MTEIERRRKVLGFTQFYMANEINVSIGCYNMYENNQRKVPVDKANKIALILKCNVNDIFIPSSFTPSEIEAKESC